MTPISIHMASLGMTLLALYCLGTQISVPMITSQLRHWRTLLAICIGQWLVLPVILACYLAILGGNDRETLAVAVVAMAPAGMFAVTALYLIGISFSAALVGGLVFAAGQLGLCYPLGGLASLTFGRRHCLHPYHRRRHPRAPAVASPVAPRPSR